MHPLLSKTATALVVSALAQGVAQAALFAVDPGPYLPANGGFASWYQDTHGRTLDLCLSKAVSSTGSQRTRRALLHVLAAADPRRFRRHPADRLPDQLSR